jgi:hypothetical protein
MAVKSCVRCGARDDPKLANPARVRRYRIDRRYNSDLCDPCRDVTATVHSVTVAERSARPSRAKAAATDE